MTKLHPALHLFTESHPLTAAMNMTFHPGEDGSLTVRLKAPESFADTDGKYVHTAFHSLLLDTVLGSCAIGELSQPMPIATIKLTCQHVLRIPVDEPIACTARWDGETNEISYVSGEIVVEASGDIASRGIATFMVGTTAKPLGSKKSAAA